VATVLILSKTADAAAADAAANQTHLWWYPLGYNTVPHPTFHPDSSLTPSPSSHRRQTPRLPLVLRARELLLSLSLVLPFSLWFSPSVLSRCTCSQRALDKMPRKRTRARGTPALRRPVLSACSRDQTNRSFQRESRSESRGRRDFDEAPELIPRYRRYVVTRARRATHSSRLRPTTRTSSAQGRVLDDERVTRPASNSDSMNYSKEVP